MSQTSILAPLLAMLCLVLLVWVWMFITRFRFIGEHKIDPADLATPQQVYSTLPPYAANPGHNFRNMFEVPVLFYVLCLIIYVTQGVDSTHVICAWVFVAFRALHSLIQCSYNNVNHRFAAYAVACVALWTMLVRTILAF